MWNQLPKENKHLCLDWLQSLYSTLRYTVAQVTTSPGVLPYSIYTLLYETINPEDTKMVSLRDQDIAQDHHSGRLEWAIVLDYCSKFPICQHFQTRPPVESRADRETLSLGDAESLYIMFCACFRFFHGNPSYSKQLCAAPAPLIPVATKHNGCYGSGSILSRFCLLGERLDELKVKCLKLSQTFYLWDILSSTLYYLSEKCSFYLLQSLLFVRLSLSPHLAT